MRPGFASLQNYCIPCQASEKLVQMTRIIQHEVQNHQSARFIVYFATCACVDYFYRVSRLYELDACRLFTLRLRYYLP